MKKIEDLYNRLRDFELEISGRDFEERIVRMGLTKLLRKDIVEYRNHKYLQVSSSRTFSDSLKSTFPFLEI